MLSGVLMMLGVTLPALAQSQTPSKAEMVELVMQQIMRSGDGASAETAYVVEGVFWEYSVVKRLGLRFERQASSINNNIPIDVIFARDAKTGQIREITFKVIPDRSRPAD